MAVVKEWVWSGLANSRHRNMGGEVVPAYETFSNGMQYPGDPAGGAEETVNCQCTLDVYDDGKTGPDASTLDHDMSLEESLTHSYDPDFVDELGPREQQMYRNFKAEAKLSDAQIEEFKDAVNLYAGDRNYEEFQKAIQKMVEGGKPVGGRERAAEDMLRLFKEAPPTYKDQVMWRGLEIDPKLIKEGTTIESRGVVSTTVNSDWAFNKITGYSESGQGIIMRTIVPKGSRIINVDGTKGFGNPMLKEGEWIHPPGTNLRITGKIGEIEGVPVYGAEMETAASEVAEVALPDIAEGVEEVISATSGPKVSGEDIGNYRMQGAFINQELRAGTIDLASDEFDAASTRAMDAAMVPITRDIKVFRGIRNTDLAQGRNPSTLVGTVLEDAGFQSTSPDAAFAEKWLTRSSGHSAGTLIEIIVRKGEKAMSMNRFKDAKEGEVVLPRNTKLKVTGASRDGSGRLNIKAEVVPNGGG